MTNKTRRIAVVLLSSILVFALAGTATAASAGDGSSMGLFRAKVMAAKGAGHGNPFKSKNLAFRGGSVQPSTKVYLSYWGPQWSAGFSTGGYASTTAQTYVNTFFGNVGGSSWINSDTQYCQNVPSGTTNCSGISGAQFIGNASGQLAGTWNDTTSVSSSPTQGDIANAALRAMTHFGVTAAGLANATFLVFTPTGHSMNGFGTSWCAWHSSTTSGGNKVAYGYIPYMPDAGGSCGMNFVNGSNNSFGNGYFDGFSVVAGHEYEEAQTDPFPSTGWLDNGGAEDADKCAWNSSSGNISLPGGHSFAVQPLWSNKANSGSGGCVMSY
jgi:hypothetical protein